MKTTVSQTIIHEKEFSRRNDITTLVISAECMKIRNKAFFNCSNIMNVVIEDSEEELSIEFDAFKGCNSVVMFQTHRPIYFYKDVNLRRKTNG